MKMNNNEEGRFTLKGGGLGTVTREMVLKRAREIAEINGRPGKVLDSDFQEAHRELTSEDLEPKAGFGENLTEDQRWEVTPDSSGGKTPKVPADEEQSFAEKLVEEGIEEAEHDQMTRATRESARRDAE